MNRLNKFYQLTNLPRRHNRAKAHMVTFQDLISFNITDDLDMYSYDLDQLYAVGLQALRQRNTDLRRGDFVFYEPFLNEYNQGKAIFNGIQITDLADDPDDYGTIPEEYQVVIEFPSQYWIELIDHNSLVPFDFPKHLGNLTLENVKTHKEGNNFILTIPFLGPNNQVYYILNNKGTEYSNLLTEAQEWLNLLKEVKYFDFYDPDSSDLPLGNFNPENILIMSDWY